MRRSMAIRIVPALLATLLLAACSSTQKPVVAPASQPGPSQAAGKELAKPTEKYAQFAGATSGGTYFLLANAMANLVGKKLGIKASAVSTPGTPKELELLHKGEADFGVVQAGITLDAYKKQGDFKDKDFTKYAAVTYLFPNVMQWIVRKDAHIKSMADLKGKRVAVGAVGSATELNSFDMFKAVGLDYRDKKEVTPEYTSEAQSVELLKNKQIVAANMIAALGSSSVIELATSGDFELLAFDDAYIAQMKSLSPAWFDYTIPANTYKGQDQPVKTFAVANWLVARADASNELVYWTLRTIYDNPDDMRASHKVAAEITLENALKGQTIPLHKGAEIFFKEKGVLK